MSERDKEVSGFMQILACVTEPPAKVKASWRGYWHMCVTVLKCSIVYQHRVCTDTL